MKIICISGKAGSGKDLSAQILKEQLETAGAKVLVTHYGDLVKFIAKQYFDWNGEKDEGGRNLLQYIGTDVVRQHNPDFWVHFILSMLTFFEDKWTHVLIPDTRFPNEVDLLKEYGYNVYHFHISRPDLNSELTEEQQNHISETIMETVRPDVIINNNGTIKDLKTTMFEFVAELGLYR